jgi:hypothetical protein
MHATAHIYLESATICGQLIERLYANWQEIPEDEREGLRSPARFLEAMKIRDSEPPHKQSVTTPTLREDPSPSVRPPAPFSMCHEANAMQSTIAHTP